MLDDKAVANPNGKLFQHEGFYRSSRDVIGRDGIKAYAMLIQKPIPPYALNPVPIFKVYRPGTGLGTDITFSDFAHGGRFIKNTSDEAIKGWTRLHNDGLRFCSHGPNCKAAKSKAGCTVGLRVQDKRVFSHASNPGRLE